MEANISQELIEWAKSLQTDYETKLGEGGDVTYYSFADSAKDFIDALLSSLGVDDEEEEDTEELEAENERIHKQICEYFNARDYSKIPPSVNIEFYEAFWLDDFKETAVSFSVDIWTNTIYFIWYTRGESQRENINNLSVRDKHKVLRNILQNLTPMA